MATSHADETRAAVLAALLAGQSVSQAARDFHIPRTTVIGWWDASGYRHATDTVGQEKTHRIGELVLGNVEAALLTLQAIARVTATPEWITKQSAENLAVYYGVVSDKAHRILAALEPERPDEPGTHDPALADLAAADES